MASNIAKPLKWTKDASEEELTSAFKRSSLKSMSDAKDSLNRASRDIPNTDPMRKMKLEGIQHRVAMSAINTASVGEVTHFGSIFCKSQKDIAKMFDFFDKIDAARWGFIDVGTWNKSSVRDIAAAGSEGHVLWRSFRNKFAPGTNIEEISDVQVLTKRVGIVSKLWNDLKREKKVSSPKEKTGSLVSILQEHIFMNGNLDNPPHIVYEKGSDGIYHVSKMLAARSKGQMLIDDMHIGQLVSALKARGKNMYEEIKAESERVVVDIQTNQDATEILFKKNSMTMDYGAMFWAILFKAGLTHSEAAEVLTSMNSMMLQCTSDKSVESFLQFKAFGSKEKIRSGVAKENEAFKKLINYTNSLGQRSKQLLDNPHVFCKSVILECLKVAGLYPLVWKSGCLFGAHDLFALRNILCMDYSDEVVKTFIDHIDGLGEAKGHIIHRGIVGGLFNNISKLDESKVTIIAMN